MIRVQRQDTQAITVTIGQSTRAFAVADNTVGPFTVRPGPGQNRFPLQLQITVNLLQVIDDKLRRVLGSLS
jgi:hypothetical protein